jgi:hypothetical protein
MGYCDWLRVLYNANIKKILTKNAYMTIKNLITFTIYCLLALVLPATAGAALQNPDSDCQAKGAICNVMAEINNQAINMPVASKTSSNCSAEINKKPTTTARSPLLVDFNVSASLSNVFDVLQGSDLAMTSQIKEDLNYDKISDSDVQNCNVNEVPIPAAGWLFATALLGFIAFSNRHRA